MKKDPKKQTSFLSKCKLAWSVLHPMAFTFFSVSLIYSANRFETTLVEYVKLLTAYSLGTVALVLLSRKIFRFSPLSSVFVSLLLIFYFSYGHVFSVIGGVAENLKSNLGFAVVWLVLFNILYLFLFRKSSLTKLIHRFLSFFTLVLLILTLWNLRGVILSKGFQEPSWMLVPPIKNKDEIEQKLEKPGKLPDIYYIVLDRYPRKDTLEELYNFDNSTFILELEKLGFQVSEDSYANYPKTDLSLTSTLNMEYLDAIAAKERKSARNPNTLWLAMHDNKVARYLQQKGYLYINIPSWWKPEMNNWAADINYIYDKASLSSSLSYELYKTTLAYPFLNTIRQLTLEEELLSPDYELARSTHIDQIRKLVDVSTHPGQKFVYVHILLPHSPYVFDRKGNRPKKPPANEKLRKELFHDQLIYTNDLILKTLRKIVKNSKIEPIMILQSDEGPYPPRYREGDIIWVRWSQLNQEELKRKYRIFLAIRAPGKEVRIKNLKTAVNIYREVFNVYFNENLSLKENKIYTTPDWQRIYDYWEITDKILDDDKK